MRPKSTGGKPLTPGDTIGVIAPSAPSELTRIERGIAYLTGRGFRIKLAFDPSEQYGKKDYLFSSASVKVRVNALHELFVDNSISAIITTRGAYGSMELLPHLDWKLIRKYAKPLVGFSDTTALLLTIYQKAKTISVHGPSVESLGQIPNNPEGQTNADSLFCLLQRRAFRDPAAVKPKYLSKHSRSVRAPLLAGNLSVYSALMGTPFEPDFARHIVCVEEVSERPFRVHRMLLQMKLAGKFKKAAAVVLGSFKDCVHPRGLGPSLEEVFKDIFGDMGIPVAHYPIFGHDSMNRAVPVGAVASLSAQGLQIRLK